MSATSAFVGRHHELTALVEALPAAGTGGVSLRLVEGAAGIGKTRLVRELADTAASAGLTVAWGQCWDEASTPPLWPWTQVVRRLLDVPRGTDLAALVLDRTDAVDDDAFALFDATAASLRRTAVATPLLIVIDDLHRADPATLHLTRFLLAHIHDAPVLIVATYRPIDAAARDELAAPLATLRSIAHTVELDGLPVEAVAAMMDDGPADTEQTSRAEGIRAVTGGNPLFIRHLMDTSTPAGVSDGEDSDRSAVAAVLHARLAGLDDAALDLLGALAVLGPSAEPTAAAGVLGPTVDLDPLARSLRAAGLIDDTRLALAHPLVADAVDETLAPTRLAALHLAAARRDSGDMPAAERAYHLCRAGDAHWAAAVDACREAADAATATSAHDDAVAHLHRALDLLRDRPDAAMIRFEVAFALARAIERSGGSVAAEGAYRRAHDLACATDSPTHVARAAARHGIAFYADERAQLARAAHCRAALSELATAEGADDALLRARLLANLAAADPTALDRVATADEAVSIARRLGDPETLGIALVAQQVADLGPTTLARRLRTSREIISVARACGEGDLAVRGRFLLKNALLEAGDTRELDAELIAQDRSITEIAEQRFSRHSLWFRCMRATLDGRAADAEMLATECLTIAQTLHDPDGFGVYTGQYGVALWLQGRLSELEPVYIDLMREEPSEPLWPAVVGWIALHDGRINTARGLLDRLAPPTEVPHGMHTLLTWFTMADLAAAVGEDEFVREMRDTLLPYADRVVPIAMGAACFGVIARPLGRLAARMGRVDEAVAHLERAIRLTARMGARPWLVDAQITLAEVLIEHGRGDDPRINTLVGEAAHATDQLELTVFEERLAHLTAGDSATAATAMPATHHTAPARAPRATVAVLGTFEVRSVDGEIARWTSRKARELLKILVARRGAPIAREEMMGLLWPDDHPDELANRLAVAVSTVRRALDPSRSLPADEVLRAEGGSLQLLATHIDVDAETFLRAAKAALDAHRADAPDALTLLQGALAIYGGEALPDEPYESWAESLRSETSSTRNALLRALSARASDTGDHLLASDALRLLLEQDPYDEQANVGFIDVLHKLGAHGQASAARDRYAQRMSELGIAREQR